MKMYRAIWQEGEGEYRTYTHKNVIAPSINDVAERYPQAEGIYFEDDVEVIEDSGKLPGRRSLFGKMWKGARRTRRR